MWMMDEEALEETRMWATQYIRAGFLSRVDIAAQVVEMLEEHAPEDDDAYKEFEEEVVRITNAIWDQQLIEQQTWGTTLYEKLLSAFEELRQQHGFVYAINEGVDVGDLRLLLRDRAGDDPTRYAYVGFHDQALDNALADGGSGEGIYLVYGPLQRPKRKFLQQQAETERIAYDSVARTIATTLAKHDVNVSYDPDRSTMVYLGDPWTKRLPEGE